MRLFEHWTLFQSVHLASMDLFHAFFKGSVELASPQRLSATRPVASVHGLVSVCKGKTLCCL